MQQVLSKNADIGFCGPGQTVYINNQGREGYPVLFAQLTQIDGAFLVGREADEGFRWTDLKGAEILGGRPGGVPEMAFEYILEQNGLDSETDVNMVTNIDFTVTSGAFKAGTDECVTLFEPTASILEKEGSGKVMAPIGEAIGDLLYTCFFATKSYMDKSPEILQELTNAIYKGQQWVESHSDEEITDSIIPFFPGTDKDIIVSVVKNYKEINATVTKSSIEEEDLTRLMNVIEGYDSGLLTDRPSFEKIVNNSFSEETMSSK